MQIFHPANKMNHHVFKEERAAKMDETMGKKDDPGVFDQEANWPVKECKKSSSEAVLAGEVINHHHQNDSGEDTEKDADEILMTLCQQK